MYQSYLPEQSPWTEPGLELSWIQDIVSCSAILRARLDFIDADREKNAGLHKITDK